MYAVHEIAWYKRGQIKRWRIAKNFSETFRELDENPIRFRLGLPIGFSSTSTAEKAANTVKSMAVIITSIGSVFTVLMGYPKQWRISNFHKKKFINHETFIIWLFCSCFRSIFFQFLAYQVRMCNILLFQNMSLRPFFYA